MDDRPEYVLSFDPGTNNLGVSLSEFDMDSGMLILEDVHTVDVERVAKTHFPDVIATHGMIYAKLEAVKYVALRMMHTWRPVVVVTEGPYFRRNPVPYKTLVECVLKLRQAVLEYDPAIPLHVIQPNVVKEAVGVKGTSNNKEDMRAALMRGLPHLNLGNTMLEDLDEHAIDGIAVGYCWVTSRIKANENRTNR